MAKTVFAAWKFLVVLAFVLAGCAGSTNIATETIPGVDCHFATTVPGGELPQPQCETPTEPTGSTEPPTPINPWECPTAEDYPITVAATSWQPFTSPPDPIPSCGGDLRDIKKPIILIPTTGIDGLSDDSKIGLAVYRQPGGIFWSARMALPVVDAVVLVEATSYSEGFPDRDVWRSAQLEQMCDSTSESLTIRESEGCRHGSSYRWITGYTAYKMTVDLDLSTDLVLEWLDTWRVAS